MPKYPAIIASRRLYVEEMTLKGMSASEIHRRLGDDQNPNYVINPDTGKPYGLATILADQRKAVERWMKEQKGGLEHRRALAIRKAQEAQKLIHAQIATDRTNAAHTSNLLKALELENKLQGVVPKEEAATNVQINVFQERMKSGREKVEQFIENLRLPDPDIIEAEYDDAD